MPKPLPELTIEERFEQVTAILAQGVIRHQRLVRRSKSPPENDFPESSPGGLEVSGDPRLSVSRRIGG